MQIGQRRLVGKPLHQCFQTQQLARIARVFPFLVGDDDQGMRIGLAEAAVGDQLFGFFPRHHVVGDQVGDGLGQR